MTEKIKTILSSIEFEFPEGFSGRVMQRIRELPVPANPFEILSEKIYRAFYWINIPGFATLLILAFLLLLSVYRSVHTGESQESFVLNDYIYNFYTSSN